jgi:4-amino-4-deoxy-L-arabinose transferase-like glycosyltransferase
MFRMADTLSSLRRVASDPVNIVFILILLLAGFLRLWQVGLNGFSGDEAVYAGQAAVLAGAHGYSRYFILVSRGNSNFLLFQEIVSLAFRVFGVGTLMPRLVSAAFGIGLVIVFYGIGRIVTGRRGALVAMLLAAVSSYAVELSRLALLDTCAAFLMALAVLLFLLWARAAREPRSRHGRAGNGRAGNGRASWYFCAFAATAVLACEAKVTSVLLVPIVVVYLALTRYYRHLTRAALLRAALAGLVALLPAVFQIAGHAGVIKAALGRSVQRTSPVPWTYYLDILKSYEGLPVLVGVLVALLCALWLRRGEDLLIWLWLLASAAFLQLYPLKAYNYLLIVVVPLTLLCGAGIARASVAVWQLARSRRLAVGVLAAGVVILAGAGAAETASHLGAQVRSVQNPGVRAVAAWLDAHTARNAGVMTLSQGSAQYAVAFYAHRDSYPFGRFRLATVLPGGQVLTSKPTPAGRLPLGWVTTYPNRYVQNGKVTYFVYGLAEQDDPSELNYAGLRMTQRNYLALIQAYGGKLVDRIDAGHHDEVLIFEATRRAPANRLKYRIDRTRIVLSGSGFTGHAALQVYYHNKQIGTARSNAEGGVTLTISYPVKTQRSWPFVVKDPQGHYAEVSGLASAAMTDKLTSSGLALTGTAFAPGTKVSITYMEATIGHANVSAKGTVSTVIHLPPKSGYRYQLRMTDSVGRSASVAGLRAAKISYRQNGAAVTVTGINFNPNVAIVLSFDGNRVGQATTNSSGGFTQVVDITTTMASTERLRAVDAYGRGASDIGLTPAAITVVPDGDSVTVQGTGFDLNSDVVIRYGQHQVGETVTGPLGTFAITVVIKTKLDPTERLTATDAQDRSASAAASAGASRT